MTVSLVCLHQPCLCRFRAIRSHLGDFPCSWGQAVLRAEGGLLPISPAKASAPFPFGEERSSVVFLLAAARLGVDRDVFASSSPPVRVWWTMCASDSRVVCLSCLSVMPRLVLAGSAPASKQAAASGALHPPIHPSTMHPSGHAPIHPLPITTPVRRVSWNSSRRSGGVLERTSGTDWGG